MAIILILDDDPNVRETIVTLAGLSGHQCLAPDTDNAMKKAIGRADYDLVITDVLMPNFDGIEAVKLIRSTKPHCPILAISGGTRQLPSDLTLHMIEVLGATSTLRKPFGRTQLEVAIAGLLKGQ